VVQFEMDEKRLGGILQTMKDIETEVNKYCQQWDIIYRMYHEYTWKVFSDWSEHHDASKSFV